MRARGGFPVGARAKKLIVAFHFQSANQAGWECDSCRKAGLERKRRCGWIGGHPAEGLVVWANRWTSVTECPKSYVLPRSLRWLEEHRVWRASGGARDLRAMPAKAADAILAVEAEMEKATKED